MRLTLLACVAAALAMAQNPLARTDAFAGTLEGDGVTLVMTRAGGEYTGTLTAQGRAFPARMKVFASGAAGTFDVDGKSFPFTMTKQGNGMLLVSAGEEYRLTRGGGAPATPDSPVVNPIVGTWRHATRGLARFNADGTGTVDGTPGRYEIHGNQLTLIGPADRTTVGFEVHGDVLTLIAGGQTLTLDRVKEETGAGGVRPELVGKWCWMTQTNVLNGARQSNRCITLNGNGSYLYEGLTDSYGPNGGATGEQSDAGTWTATETTITAHSRSGKTTTYQLEKRNHPKNQLDPMIVLDGQPFVTFYNKPPW